MFKVEGAMLGYLYTVASLMGNMFKLEGTMSGFLCTVASLMIMFDVWAWRRDVGLHVLCRFINEHVYTYMFTLRTQC